MTHMPAGVRTALKEHLMELQTRLIISAGMLIAASGVAYAAHDILIGIVQNPLGESLYYTSPGGSFLFTFKISLIFGIVASAPVWFYQLVRFIEPALNPNFNLRRWRLLLSAHLLFAIGMMFGYFAALPAALKFLTGFGGENLEALITVDEYLSFVMTYLIGFGLMFLVPLFIMIINRAKPLQPLKMLKGFSWVILVSFIIAALLTPTPDPFNQMLMAGPIIGMYALSTIMVYFTNRTKVPKLVKAKLKDKDYVFEIKRPQIAVSAQGPESVQVQKTVNVANQKPVRSLDGVVRTQHVDLRPKSAPVTATPAQRAPARNIFSGNPQRQRVMMDVLPPKAV